MRWPCRRVSPKHHAQAEISRLAAYYLTDDSAAVRRADEILGASDGHSGAVKACALAVRALDQRRTGRVDKAISILRDTVELNCATTVAQLLDPRWILTSLHTKLGELEEAIVAIRASSRARADLSSRCAPGTHPSAPWTLGVHVIHSWYRRSRTARDKTRFRRVNH